MSVSKSKSPPQRRPTAAEIGLTLGLTPRQGAVLQCVWQDLPDKLIAPQLVMSVPTVRAHLVEIFKRLGVKSRLAAALAWERASIIDIDDSGSDK
jgi:DNA-binding NarL/FixJ family response regulator